VAQAVHSQVVLDQSVVNKCQHLAVPGKTLIERIQGALAQRSVGIVQQREYLAEI